MTYRTYRTYRRRRLAFAGLLGLVAAIAAASGSDLLETSSSTAASPGRAVPREHRRALGEPAGATSAVPDGTTVFDDAVPGVAHLDPQLLAALRQAAADAGIAFVVDSGWRSADYQARLLDEAVSKYGSAEEAARWVAPPDRSAHVSGDAVDLGSDAAAWLSEQGAAYGLCQIYDNEPWHYELRPEAPDFGCPPRYADPTHDPRMQ